MYRVRLHGRGGQGIKTAGRVLGTALFLEGFEVQDAPRYGAERRGAPISSAVRADRRPIHERGVIDEPDIVAIADDTLVGQPTAGATEGLSKRGTLLIVSDRPADEWIARTRAPGRVVVVDTGDRRFASIRAAAAAARLLGVVSRRTLERALDTELGNVPPAARADSARAALAAFDAVDVRPVEPSATDGEARSFSRPDWIELPLDPAGTAAPAIHASANAGPVRTGLWRSHRPVVHEEHCHRCVWICGTLCPDNAISVAPTGYPAVDLDHCKGCLICVLECPSHAIEAVDERGDPSTTRAAGASLGSDSGVLR